MGKYGEAIHYFSEAKKYLNSSDPGYKLMDQHIMIAEEIIKSENNAQSSTKKEKKWKKYAH